MFGRRRKRRLLLAHAAIVNLKTGSAVRGVILNHDGDVYVIARAELLTTNLPPQPIDGTVVVDLENVDFVQLLPAGIPLPPPPNAGG
jgi:hypothetical protein